MTLSVPPAVDVPWTAVSTREPWRSWTVCGRSWFQARNLASQRSGLAPEDLTVTLQDAEQPSTD